MSSQQVDAYIDALDEPRRSMLRTLRRMILAEIPQAEEVISYGVPGFRIGDVVVAGISAARNHVSYLPHSGNILDTLDAEQLQGFVATKGALKMPVDTPLPQALVAELISLRRAQASV